MKCKLLDVFAHKKLSGNGLTVFYDYGELSKRQMLALTQEMRQFESIFLSIDNGKYKARIFTVEEELDFAGHPLIGLAAHLHEEFGAANEHQWQIELNHQTVELVTRRVDDYYQATMNQGRADFIKSLNADEASAFISVLNIDQRDIAPYPLEVISTGLPYLIVALAKGIDRVKIVSSKLESLLASHGAKFIYVLDVENFEGRTWDHLGQVEDIATGSAAGPAGAFLHKHGLVSEGLPFQVNQGRFVGRPSQMSILIDDCEGRTNQVFVSGQVCKVANIEFV